MTVALELWLLRKLRHAASVLAMRQHQRVMTRLHNTPCMKCNQVVPGGPAIGGWCAPCDAASEVQS